MRLLLLLLLVSCGAEVEHLSIPTSKINKGELKFTCGGIRTFRGCRELGYSTIDGVCRSRGYKQGELLFDGLIPDGGKFIHTLKKMPDNQRKELTFYMQYKCVNK